MTKYIIGFRMSNEPNNSETRELSEQQKKAVLETLRSMLKSPHFSKSKRYPALLQYSVRNTLDGNIGALKERIIGAELFGRPLNYETSSDPVVRVVAGELRRRIALYFNEHTDATAYIDLPLGCYVARFSFPDPSRKDLGVAAPGITTVGGISDGTECGEGDETLERIPGSDGDALSLLSEDEHESECAPDASGGVVSPVGSSASRSRRTLVALVLTAVVLCGIGYFSLRGVEHFKNARSFWWPVLHTQTPALIILGHSDQALSVTNVTNDQHHVILDNAIVAANICRVFGEYHHDCAISPVQSTTIADMHNKAVVLIGGLDNPWTERLMARLRYQFNFERRSGSDVPESRVILDTWNAKANTDWKIGYGTTRSKQDQFFDYAIIARYQSDMTEGPVVIIAGASPLSTGQAGEFAGSPELMPQVLAKSPHLWAGNNFEAVLQIEVIDGHPGRMNVIAAQYW